MRVHVNERPDATVSLDGEPVKMAVEADDAEGWVDVVMEYEDWPWPLPKKPESVRPWITVTERTVNGRRVTMPAAEHPRFRLARLRGAVRIELGDETGG